MRAFNPDGITSDRQALPYHQFPVIQSHETRQFPEVYGLRKLPDVQSNKIRWFPATHSGQERSPIADTLRKFPEVDGD
jgi:hypothetical protein